MPWSPCGMTYTGGVIGQVLDQARLADSPSTKATSRSAKAVAKSTVRYARCLVHPVVARLLDQRTGLMGHQAQYGIREDLAHQVHPPPVDRELPIRPKDDVGPGT